MPPGARRKEDDEEPGVPEPEPEDETEGLGGVTGIENIERQQKDPDLEDTAGGHP